MSKVLYAITGHGFGHASRSLAIAAELATLRPQLEIVLSTSIPQRSVEYLTGGKRRGRLRETSYEPGALQKNCFEVDLDATRAAYRQLAGEWDGRVEADTAYLRKEGVACVVADVPAAPIAAAAAVGVPAVAVSNFSWDWILEPVFAGDSELEAFGARLAADYALATRYLRLPLHADADPFPSSEDAPLVGRVAPLSRDEALARLEIDGDDPRPLVLVAVGGWPAETWSGITVAGCERYRFLVVDELPLRFADAEAHTLSFYLRDALTFPDLVRAADLGVVKPGYGTSAEFILNRTAMVGIQRTDFREYPHLTRAVAREIPFSEITLADFFAGRWEPALDAIARTPLPPPRWGQDGARRVAERVLELAGL